MRTAYAALVFVMAAGTRPAAAEDVPSRLGKSVAVLNKLTDSSGHGIRLEQITSADCVVVIPGFKKGAAVVGVSYGRGFISCRNGESCSAPGAITLEGGSLGVQISGEKIDIVILSLDKERRSKLLPTGSQSARMLPLRGEMESPSTLIRTPGFSFSVKPREPSPALTSMASR